MNLDHFIAKNYSSKEWVNYILNNSNNNNKEINTAPLQEVIVNLQQQIENVHKLVEYSCLKITNNLPDIISETKLLEDDVLVFAEQLQFIKQEIKNFDDNTDDSVVKIGKIDRLEVNLINVKQSLHEADKWSNLTADIEKCFDRGEIQQITSILIALQQSLNVLSGTDDYEEKKMQLESFKNQFEAVIGKHVEIAFIDNDSDESIKYVKLFDDIGRLPQLVLHYIRCQKHTICMFWKSLIDTDQNKNLSEQLSSLYDMLLNNWQKQIRWSSHIFTSTNIVETMIMLYTESLKELCPSIECHIKDSLEQSDKPLLLLLDFYRISKRFQKNLEALYLFNNDSGFIPNWMPVLRSLYSPYTDFINNYGILERKLLDLCLWDCFSKLETDSDLKDHIRNIGLTISSVIDYARDAEKRCFEFTHGFSLKGLIDSLNGFFFQYICKYEEICKRLLELSNLSSNINILTTCLLFQKILGELFDELNKYILHLKHLITDCRNKYELKQIILYTPINTMDLENLFENFSNSENAVFNKVISAVERIALQVHKISFEVSFKPIAMHLEKVKDVAMKLNTDDRDLPDYSYAPLEYITQIGEHLITLPQYLEPYLSHDNVTLNMVLEIIKKKIENLSCDKSIYANVLLTMLAQRTCKSYSDHILNVKEMSAAAVKQISADINYLGNVLLDLGTNLTEDLQNILQLLRLPADNYQMESIGFPPILVAAIRQIRQIQSF